MNQYKKSTKAKRDQVVQDYFTNPTTNNRNRIIVEHMHLVNFTLKRLRFDEADTEDAIQQAVFGLIHAIEKFDPTKGVQFSTYAHYYVSAYAGKFLKKAHSHAIGAIVSEAYGDIQIPMRRLDQAIDNDGEENGTTLLDTMSSNCEPADKVLDRRQSAANVRNVLKDIAARSDERTRAVIFRRILADEERLLQEVGDEIGISRERVRQIEFKVLREAKHLLHANA